MRERKREKEQRKEEGRLKMKDGERRCTGENLKIVVWRRKGRDKFEIEIRLKVEQEGRKWARNDRVKETKEKKKKGR